MAERKSQNKYYPPDWTPEAGSLNKFQGRHPLGVRGKRAAEGIIVVRFEMPFNVWCEGCGRHIAKGVRFNAEKQQSGAYHSTKIWSFSFACPSCPQRIVVRTDPQHTDYVMAEGAKRKEETWDQSSELTGAPQLADEEERRRLAEDALYRLEKAADDRSKARQQAPHVAQLEDAQEHMRDDYAANAAVRRAFRADRKARAEAKAEGRAAGLAVPLLQLTQEDGVEAEIARLRRAARVVPVAVGAKRPMSGGSALFAGSETASKRRALLQRAARQGLDVAAFRPSSGVPAPLLGPSSKL